MNHAYPECQGGCGTCSRREDVGKAGKTGSVKYVVQHDHQPGLETSLSQGLG